MWGTSVRQRLRLLPLYAALTLSRHLPARAPPRVDADTDAWRPGVSLIIPERDAPHLLAEALASAEHALAALHEPTQVIVVVNGAPPESYAALRADHPAVEWLHEAAPLGFSAAVARGLGSVRHDWTFLMNNDVTLAPDALAELVRRRAAGVFSLSSQIIQRSADGRREETGFTDWYADAQGLHAYHAPVPDTAEPVPHLAGSGGATLFRTRTLSRYAQDSLCYDPFYWEDIEWGVRAWREGHVVQFCARSLAWHRHRATTARFYDASELDRIVARNAVLFDARNRATRFGAAWLMQRVCDLPYASQHELAHPGVAAAVFRSRVAARHALAPLPPPVLADPHRGVTELASHSFSYRLRAFASGGTRPRLLLVTPYAAFPPRHGGARRIAGLLAHLRRDFDVVLVTDEASLHDARSFAGFDGLCAVHLVQRPREDARTATARASLDDRIRSHAHPLLSSALREAMQRYRPDIVQIEFAELASLVVERTAGARWVLGLHDAYTAGDFATPAALARFEHEWLDRYDAVTVCSDEDAQLVRHRNVVRVANASSLEPGRSAPSNSARLLFLGPFRYAPNLAGVRAFLRDAYPAIKASVPDATLRILGGDGARQRVAGDPLFARDDVEVVDHREDIAAELADCALTVNPLTQIRGSPIKLVESLAAGRACVSTAEGSRGFRDDGLVGLVVVDDVAAMAAPIVRLLLDPAERHRVESADQSQIGRYTWARSAEVQRALYRRLMASNAG
jgi:GT2 family glycosyltransferase/glycosyltransferase involved in cell wall biosynthesis